MLLNAAPSSCGSYTKFNPETALQRSKTDATFENQGCSVTPPDAEPTMPLMKEMKSLWPAASPT